MWCSKGTLLQIPKGDLSEGIVACIAAFLMRKIRLAISNPSIFIERGRPKVGVSIYCLIAPNP